MFKCPKKLTNLFSGFTKKPTEEENRLYECMKALTPLEKKLKLRMLPMLETNEALHQDIKSEVRTWSFDFLLKDRLQQKGWSTFPQEGQDVELCGAIQILSIQAECSRLSFGLVLADYKKKGHPRANAAKFLCENVGALEQVIADLKTFEPKDLQPNHQCVFTAREGSNPQPN